MADAEQQLVQYFEIALAEVLELAVVEFGDGAVDFFDDRFAGRGERDPHDATVFTAPLAAHEAGLFEAVDEPRDIGLRRDHPLGDLIDLHRLAFAAKDAKGVVLRAGESVLLEQMLGLAGEDGAGAGEIEHRLLGRAVEWIPLAELLGEVGGACFCSHALIICHNRYRVNGFVLG
jgi:hypothetical protein